METPHSSRLCDFCGESTALVYCKADSAKLCFVCDRQVHSTNQLFSKHTRWLLCDSCDSTPATIFCFSDSSVFCQNCDWEAHSHSSRGFPAVHDRRPLEGFSGCPSVTELLGILGFEDLGKKELLIGGGGGDSGGKVEEDLGGNDVEYMYGLSEFLDWEPPTVVNLDDVLLFSKSSPAQHKFQAMRVPPLPKNRNATCGLHKEEILSQLREMSKLEPEFDGDFEPLGALLSEEINHIEQSEIAPKLATSYESEGFQWSCDAEKAADFGFSSGLEMNYLVPDAGDNSSSGPVVNSGAATVEEQCVPIGVGTFQMLPQLPIREPLTNSKERDSAISRYKEKKKTRRYEKHIRYESRKIRAASRIRIKGRFAKMAKTEP
uniref:Gentian CONSTANS-like13 homolog n=1 Tax=Gentiana triflora TaxID=55190 RepID=A0A0K2SF24_GENTR|nr:gentian CONSTANS-like13 homolog [Gentiana triflora]